MILWWWTRRDWNTRYSIRPHTQINSAKSRFITHCHLD